MSKIGIAMDQTNEPLALMQYLRNALERLEAINAFAAAAHLDACLHALSNHFISEANTSKDD